MKESPSNYKFVLNQIPFSVEQLENIVNSIDEGISLLNEQQRKDVIAYNELRKYFDARLKRSRKPAN